ncbi:MAG: hypothetical protein CMG14_02705 [Candidatus Marinimicrobia bacterium]|nr:hypothetical protein [Candidatus Neomarinimicrobiota bacterium]
MILIFSFIFKCFLSLFMMLIATNYLVKEKIDMIKSTNLSILTLSSTSILTCMYNFSYDSNLMIFLVGLLPVTLVFLLCIYSDNNHMSLYLLLFSNIVLISLNYIFIVIILNFIYYINSIYFEQFNEFFYNEKKYDEDNFKSLDDSE